MPPVISSDPTTAFRVGAIQAGGDPDARQTQLLGNVTGQQATLAGQQQGRLGQLRDVISQQEQQVNTIADLFRQAGLANAANRFQRAQRAALFESARRGQQGSSIEASRLNETQQNLRQDVAGVEQQTAQQRSQGLLGTLQLQRQLSPIATGANPFGLLGNQLEAQSLAQRTQNLATLQGGRQELVGVGEQAAALRGQILGNALSSLGTTGRGAILGAFGGA